MDDGTSSWLKPLPPYANLTAVQPLFSPDLYAATAGGCDSVRSDSSPEQTAAATTAAVNQQAVVHRISVGVFGN